MAVLAVKDVGAAMKELINAGIEYADIDIRKPGLDQAFKQLTMARDES